MPTIEPWDKPERIYARIAKMSGEGTDGPIAQSLGRALDMIEHHVAHVVEEFDSWGHGEIGLVGSCDAMVFVSETWKRDPSSGTHADALQVPEPERPDSSAHRQEWQNWAADTAVVDSVEAFFRLHCIARAAEWVELALNAAIVEGREAGLTFNEIAEAIRLSPQAVQSRQKALLADRGQTNDDEAEPE